MTVEMSRSMGPGGAVTTDTVHWAIGKRLAPGVVDWVTSTGCETGEKARATLARLTRDYPDVYGDEYVVIRRERTVTETPWVERA